MHLLLSGVVGSQAYGLAGPESDTDRLAVYAAPTILFHGLNPPMGREATVVEKEPGDITYHEAGKFAKLCLGGNPTVTELLWLDKYETEHWLGRRVVDIRTAFLSRRRVREAYFGYATGQFYRLKETGQFQSKMRARSAKHARHLLRLLDQGINLYATGQLIIKVADPQYYIDWGNKIAEDSTLGQRFLTDATERFEAITSPLPEEPDIDRVEEWLQSVRHHYYRPTLAD